MSDLHNDNSMPFAGGRGQSTLTAFFDSQSDAESAIERLKDAGVTNVRLMPGYEADSDKAEVVGHDRGGFWAKLGDWLLPEEDRALYAEGLRRGGFLVSADVDDATYDTAHDILDDEGSIDMDERADVWRTEGWNARKSNEPDADTSRVGGIRDADRALQAGAASDDVFAADAAGSATSIGRYARRASARSPRVRAYDLEEDVPLDQDLRDDILPTEHQRTVDEASENLVERDLGQSQELEELRQEQSFPRNR
ncbi:MULTISPECIES: hypothetical protein [unclassified Sinorhizobium]|uniref:hypothetical protein n=1 Tax=unclassified Sinorhizobium TaxID=2613772 RepID=UPI00352359FC